MSEPGRLLNRKNTIKQKNQRLIPFVCLALIAVTIIGVTVARYGITRTSAPGQVTSNNFYFTADLLGDTKMIPTEAYTSDHYYFGEDSTEGTWQLYGGSKHIITILVQNYYDELRVEEMEITYTTKVSVKDKNGNEISFSESSTRPTLTNSNTGQNGYVMTGNHQVTDTLQLTIPSYTEWNYQEGTIISVEITSSKPYEKTLKLNFQIFATDVTLQYRVIDTEGSPYAQLVIMTNVESGSGTASVQPYIKWPESLSIDNTNKLTFTRVEDGSFVQQDGIEERNMQISESLPTGRSEAIYFFKENTQKNYSVTDTVVLPVTTTVDANTVTTYTIDLSALAQR